MAGPEIVPNHRSKGEKGKKVYGTFKKKHLKSKKTKVRRQWSGEFHSTLFGVTCELAARVLWFH